jgi:hypothetical protein
MDNVIKFVSKPVQILWSPNGKYPNWRIGAQTGQVYSLVAILEERKRAAEPKQKTDRRQLLADDTIQLFEVFVGQLSWGVHTRDEYNELILSMSTGDYNTHRIVPVIVGQGKQPKLLTDAPIRKRKRKLSNPEYSASATSKVSEATKRIEQLTKLLSKKAEVSNE